MSENPSEQILQEEREAWANPLAQEIANRHVVSPFSVHRWLKRGVSSHIVEHLASLSDHGISEYTIDAMVNVMLDDDQR